MASVADASAGPRTAVDRPHTNHGARNPLAVWFVSHADTGGWMTTLPWHTIGIGLAALSGVIGTIVGVIVYAWFIQ